MMNKKDLIIWLYEQKDNIDYKLHVEGAEGAYREQLWAQVNLLDTIIAKVKKELAESIQRFCETDD